MVRLSAVAKSLIFHVLWWAGFVVTMPFLSRDIAPEQPILTVDIVNKLPETNLDEGVEGKLSRNHNRNLLPKIKPRQPPPPAPPPAPAPAPEPEPQPSVAEEVAEAVPVP